LTTGCVPITCPILPQIAAAFDEEAAILLTQSGEIQGLSLNTINLTQKFVFVALKISASQLLETHLAGLAVVHCVRTITPTNEEDFWIIQSNAYSLRPLKPSMLLIALYMQLISFICSLYMRVAVLSSKATKSLIECFKSFRSPFQTTKRVTPRMRSSSHVFLLHIAS
jgi:hypothetical protein